jgi:hypothetical protein
LRHGAAPTSSPRTEGRRRRVSPLQRWFNPRVEHRGSSRSKPLKPSRAERRMCPVFSWRRHSCAFTFLHTGLRTHRASGVPHALSTEGDDVNRTSDVETRREIAHACRVARGMQIRANAPARGEAWSTTRMLSPRCHSPSINCQRRRAGV